VFLLSGPQPLPRIDLDNYSALPVDEGDEDRLAGNGDEYYEGSDLDLGDDSEDTGETRLGLHHRRNRTRRQNECVCVCVLTEVCVSSCVCVL